MAKKELTPEVTDTPETPAKKAKKVDAVKLITQAKENISDTNPFKHSIINTLDEVLEKL